VTPAVSGERTGTELGAETRESRVVLCGDATWAGRAKLICKARRVPWRDELPASSGPRRVRAPHARFRPGSHRRNGESRCLGVQRKVAGMRLPRLSTARGDR